VAGDLWGGGAEGAEDLKVQGAERLGFKRRRESEGAEEAEEAEGAEGLRSFGADGAQTVEGLKVEEAEGAEELETFGAETLRAEEAEESGIGYEELRVEGFGAEQMLATGPKMGLTRLTRATLRHEEKITWISTVDISDTWDSEHVGRKVRMRDRTLGVKQGEISAHRFQGEYELTFPETNEVIWMRLPNADVDFTMAVESANSRRQTQKRISGLMFQCEACGRYFGTKQAMHIHLGKAEICKNVMLPKLDKLERERILDDQLSAEMKKARPLKSKLYPENKAARVIGTKKASSKRSTASALISQLLNRQSETEFNSLNPGPAYEEVELVQHPENLPLEYQDHPQVQGFRVWGKGWDLSTKP